MTIYDDPLNLDPSGKRTVLVTNTYVHGASTQNANGKEVPGVISILEAAYGQMYDGGTRGSSLFGPDGISGGRSGPTMEEITGRGSETLNKGFHGFGDGYDRGQREGIREALKEQRPVTASTVSSFPWTDETVENEVLVNGKKEKIILSRNHTFVVVAADESGITLRNPWNSNYGTDGDPHEELAEFKMTWDEFGSAFGHVDIGGKYP